MDRSKLYLDTLEEFITKSEHAEVNSLAIGTEQFTRDQLSDYWSDYYPVHWEEIFATRLRSAFVIQLCSLLESELLELCDRVGIISGDVFNPKQGKGSLLGKSKKYLELHPHFKSPAATQWSVQECIFDLRNVIVHHRGFIESYSNKARLECYSKIKSGISIEHGFIKLERTFCDQVLEIATEFDTSLISGWNAYRTSIIASKA